MCNCLVHGGPDDGGIFSQPTGNLVLGNRRLALQDLSDAGHQPMHYANRFTITYNGELYNFPELKKELIGLGHVFHNHTDTEVILAAFSQWHTQCFRRFKGMFAFALWDDLEKELYLVRDTSGMKPLYYSLMKEGLIFASEIRALRSVGLFPQQNRNWPVYLLAFGHIPEPVTTLSNVTPLQKGFFLKYSYRTHKSSLQSFAHYSFSDHSLSRHNASSKLSGLMKQAVERHLISDASIGVFLSGGLDSSIIATVASKINKSRLNTLSLYFNEERYSEKRYQDLVINRIQCNSYQHLLTETEFHECIPEFVSAMDMPGCDGINTWFISRYARQSGLKAVLSGIGGDELFGGYPSFKRMKLASYLQKVPGMGLNAGLKSSVKQINRMSYLKLGGIKGLYLFLRGQFTPYGIARQLGATEKEIWNILSDLPVYNPLFNLEHKNTASWMEFHLYMQNQLLRDADVMGMAQSIEIRVPFLDDDVIRFAMSLNTGTKYSGSHNKQMLVDSFKDDLDPEIYSRRKMGFSFPFAQWLGSSQYVKDTLSASSGETKANFEKFKAGKLHWSKLLSVLLLELKK